MKRLSVWIALICMMVASLSNGMALAQPVPERSNQFDIETPAVDGEFLVLFDLEVSPEERAKIVTEMGGTILHEITRLGIVVVGYPEFKDPKAIEELFVRYKQFSQVFSIDRNIIYTIDWVPNDPLLSHQWHLDTIGAFSAWDINTGTPDVVIAVIDTGIELSHSDLKDKLISGYSVVNPGNPPNDTQGHGTHVAGTAAAMTNNGVGVAGVCPECSLMPLQVFTGHQGSMNLVITAIDLAVSEGASVINLSLGGVLGTPALRRAVDDAWNAGVFLVCSAGNDNSNSPRYPANYDRCMAVAATDIHEERWVDPTNPLKGSNYGLWVDIAAPGHNIAATYIGNNYVYSTGTSMAAPIVAGYAGLLKSMCFHEPKDIWKWITNLAEQIEGTDELWRAGRVSMNLPLLNPCSPRIEVPFAGPRKLWIPDLCMCEILPDLPWIQRSRGLYELISKEFTKSGSYSAWLGGYNYADDVLEQYITIPKEGVLSFSWYQSTHEVAHAISDEFTVRLIDPSSGMEVTTLHRSSGLDARNEWVRETIDLSEYGGQSLILQFRAITDSVLPTSFFVDELSLR